MIAARLAGLLIAGLGSLVGAGGQAQSSDAGVPASPAREVFVRDWDAVCAAGTALGEGCAAIRARAIADSTALPWSAIGRVNFAGTQVRGYCTGTLVGERIVATAAHCLYNDARKTWVPPGLVRFAAGYQRGRATAIATVERYVLDPGQDPGSRVFTAGPARDWALLILDEPIGRGIGYLTPLTDAGTGLGGQKLAVAGYAGLRAHVLSVDEGCAEARLAAGGRVLLLDCATMRGDSGGPVLALDGDDVGLVGVLSGVFRDGGALVAGAVPAGNFEDALLSELGGTPWVAPAPAPVSGETAAQPGQDAPGDGREPPSAAPAPRPAPIPVYPVPNVGR